MLIKKKSPILKATRFDPFCEHRTILPNGIYCIPSPGADNYSYEGCKFFLYHDISNISSEWDLDVLPGDYIIKENNGKYIRMPKADFMQSYEIVQEDDKVPSL